MSDRKCTGETWVDLLMFSAPSTGVLKYDMANLTFDPPLSIVLLLGTKWAVTLMSAKQLQYQINHFLNSLRKIALVNILSFTFFHSYYRGYTFEAESNLIFINIILWLQVSGSGICKNRDWNLWIFHDFMAVSTLWHFFLKIVFFFLIQHK